MANLNFLNEFAKKFVSEYDITDIAEIDLYDVTYFIDENWEEITGSLDKDSNIIPDEVSQILDELDVEEDDFLDAWGELKDDADFGDFEEDESYFEED
jgi:hypothetical protein